MKHMAWLVLLACALAGWCEPIPTDTPPYMAEGRVMVPMRVIFEWLGATVAYDNATATITARRGDTVVSLRAGDAQARVNGAKVSMGTAAVSREGTTFVPLRFVAEALGAQVAWDEAAGTVTVRLGERVGTMRVPGFGPLGPGEIRATSLGSAKPPGDVVGYCASSDRRHVAIHVRSETADGHTDRVYVDGVPGKVYDEIPKYSVRFAGDSDVVVYDAWQSAGGQSHIYRVVGGTEIANVDEYRISSDGRHVACVVYDIDEQRQRTIIDGVRGRGYQRISGLTMSPDGTRVGYFAWTTDPDGPDGRPGARHYRVVIDGVESPRAFDDGWGIWIEFSADSKHVSYGGMQRATKWLVVDGIEEATESRWVFSPDWKRRASVVADGGKYRVVLDGKVGASAYDDVSNVVFSDDGKHLAYEGQVGTNRRMVVDGIEGTVVGDAFYGFSFSRDGSRFGYYVHSGDIERTVVDDVGFSRSSRPILSNSLTLAPVFSPDSKHVSFAVAGTKGYCVVSDGVAGRDYMRVFTPVYSSDSQHVAYVAVANEAFAPVLVVDGAVALQCDRLFGFAFAPNGGRFVALIGRKSAHGYETFLSVGGREIKLARWGEPAIAPASTKWGATISFAGSDQVTTIMQRGDELIRLDISLSE